jgi:glutamate--cysteine ligase
VLEKLLTEMKQQPAFDFSSCIARGIEKEHLRVTSAGSMAQTFHPKALGSKLTNPVITTDYSEALLEFVTPPMQGKRELLDYLTSLQQFVYANAKDELLWPSSMPCDLPDPAMIPLADYGKSNGAIMKKVYRQGLTNRYGGTMQMIAGIHYNFSVNHQFFHVLKDLEQSKETLPNYINQKYMGLVRNFLRYAWVLPYLLGASPVCANTSVIADVDFLKPLAKDSMYGPYATSLRLSELGYHNKGQDLLHINFNTVQDYAKTLLHATQQPYPEFQAMGLKDNQGYHQLSEALLQIENEYYNVVRPKQPIKPCERPATSLLQRGVNYVEIRILDLNPLLDLNIDESTMDFMDMFLLFCLMQDSPPMTDESLKECQDNIKRIAEEGRRPDVKISVDNKEQVFREAAMELFKQIENVALTMDDATGRSKRAFNEQLDKIKDPELTPSSQLLTTLLTEKLGCQEFFLMRAKQIKSKLMQRTVDSTLDLPLIAKQSLEDFHRMDAEKQGSFEDYLARYFAS